MKKQCQIEKGEILYMMFCFPNLVDWPSRKSLLCQHLFNSLFIEQTSFVYECILDLDKVHLLNLKLAPYRMPAVLDGEEEVRRWLDFGEVRSLEALELLRPKNALTFHPVSSFVNNSRNNSPECLQPVDPNIKKV